MTATKTPTTIVSTIKGDLPATPAEKKRAAVDRWERLNEKAEKACADRLTARDEVLSMVKHGTKIKASSGVTYIAVNESKSTNAHEKVAKDLIAQLGLTDKQVKALYKKHAGSRTEKAIKPV